MNAEKELTIQLLIIEDNATLILAGLRGFFRPGRDQIRVSEVFDDVAEAIEKADRNSFDLILLDLFIPGTNPKENIQALHREFPSKPVVIYTSMDSDLWRRTMWNLGARGYVHKNDGRDKLKAAIVQAFSGKAMAPRGFPTEIEINEAGFEFQANGLSIIEKEMVTMLVGGMKYKEISAALKIKTDYLEAMAKKLRKKYGAKSMPQLIYKLSEKGLL